MSSQYGREGEGGGAARRWWQRVPVTCLRVQLERAELGRGGRRWRGSASAVSSPRTGPREKGSTCLRRGRAAPPALRGRGFSRPVGCHFPVHVHARRSASTPVLLQSLTPGMIRLPSSAPPPPTLPLPPVLTGHVSSLLPY